MFTNSSVFFLPDITISNNSKENMRQGLTLRMEEISSFDILSSGGTRVKLFLSSQIDLLRLLPIIDLLFKLNMRGESFLILLIACAILSCVELLTFVTDTFDGTLLLPWALVLCTFLFLSIASKLHFCCMFLDISQFNILCYHRLDCILVACFQTYVDFYAIMLQSIIYLSFQFFFRVFKRNSLVLFIHNVCTNITSLVYV